MAPKTRRVARGTAIVVLSACLAVVNLAEPASASFSFAGTARHALGCSTGDANRNVAFDLAVMHTAPDIGGTFTVGVTNLQTPDAPGITTMVRLLIDGPVESPGLWSFPGTETFTTTGPGTVTIRLASVHGFVVVGTNHYPYQCLPMIDGVEASPIVAAAPLTSVAAVVGPAELQVVEGQGANVTLSLSSPLPGGATIDVAPVGGSATAVEDFDPTIRTASFAAGSSTATVTIPTVDDAVVEGGYPAELMVGQFVNASSDVAFVGSIGVRLADNEPSYFISAPTVVETDEGTASVYITVTLSEPAPTRRSVTFWTLPASASLGEDYLPKEVTVAFAAGSRQKTVTVRVPSDAAVESNEVFVSSVLQSDGLRACAADQPVTIVDLPPGGPSVAIGDTDVLEGDSGARVAKFAVTLSHVPTSTVTVQWSTVDGTASADAGDFSRRTNRTLTFRPGQQSKAVVVPIVPDIAPEGNEAFSVVLSNPVGVVLADSSGTATIVENSGYCSQP